MLHCLFMCPRSTARRTRLRRTDLVCVRHCLCSAQRVVANRAVEWNMMLAMHRPALNSPLFSKQMLRSTRTKSWQAHAVDALRTKHALEHLHGGTHRTQQGDPRHNKGTIPHTPDLARRAASMRFSKWLQILGQLGTPFWQAQELASRGHTASQDAPARLLARVVGPGPPAFNLIRRL